MLPSPGTATVVMTKNKAETVLKVEIEWLPHSNNSIADRFGGNQHMSDRFFYGSEILLLSFVRIFR